jgi:hypothetical protein
MTYVPAVSRRRRVLVFTLVLSCIQVGAVLTPSAAETADATLAAIRAHYGDPCKRPEHNYLVEELGKPCVPVLSTSELSTLQSIYNSETTAQRLFLRFAYTPAVVRFEGKLVDAKEFLVLDANKSTYPSGSIPSEGITTSFSVLNEHGNWHFEAERDLVVPNPP